MILLLLLALAVALVPLFGGNLRALSGLRFRAPWLLWASLGCLALLIALPGEQTWWRTALNIGTYPLALAFAWINRRVPGMWVIMAGATLNLAAILANGGVMPASLHALQVAGLPTTSGLYSNSAALADPRLLFLGDVLPIPSSWPFANVYSVGDVLIVLGAAFMIHRVCGSRLAGRPKPATS